MEDQSRQDIHTGIKERANSIHQTQSAWTNLDGARTQGHKYAKGQEFRRGEHLQATKDETSLRSSSGSRAKAMPLWE